MQTVRIYENLRTLSYAPFYVALERKFYQQFELDVQMLHSPSPRETALGLMAGRVDISFGGPMRVTIRHDQDPECALNCVCQVVGPEPFVLVGRKRNDTFTFADLLGLRVATVSEVPTPWLLLQDDLRRAGIAPDTLNQSEPRTMAENVIALANNEVDVIQVMEPHSSTALAHEHAHLWHQFSTRGNLGFTTYYTTRHFADNNRELCVRLSRATMAGIEWMYAVDATEVAATIADRFEDIPDTVLVDGIRRYQSARVWATEPELEVHEFVKLKGALLSGGLIASDVPFDRVVDNALVRL